MGSYKPHLVLYSHDTFGLGHLRRNLAISHQFAVDYPQISQLLITGSTQVHHYKLPASLDYVKLPSIEKTGNSDYRSRTLDLDSTEIIRWRANMILQAVHEFQPDILLVDKAPAGMAGELRPTLDYLKRESPLSRIIFGMRDIIDSADATRAEWADEGIYHLLEETYDAVLLYGSRSLFDPIGEYGLSSRVAAKLTECGYIKKTDPTRSKEEILAEIKPKGAVLLVITSGGGGDGAALMRTVFEMLVNERQAGRSLFHVFAVTGPLMSGEDRMSLYTYAHRDLPLTMVEFTHDLMSYLNAADVVVSMGGYNTVSEILGLRRRAIIVPRASVRAEQLIRAERLATRRQVRLIHPAQLTPSRLREEIDLALASPPPDPERAGIDMGGLEKISFACGEFLGLGYPNMALTPSLLSPVEQIQ